MTTSTLLKRHAFFSTSCRVQPFWSQLERTAVELVSSVELGSLELSPALEGWEGRQRQLNTNQSNTIFFVKLHPFLHTVVTPGLYGYLFLLHHPSEQQGHCRCIFVILRVFRLLNNSHKHTTMSVKTVILLPLAPSWSIVYGYHCWFLFQRTALQLCQWNLLLLLEVVMSTAITDTSVVCRKSTAVALKYAFNHFLFLPQWLNSVTQPLHGGIQKCQE